MICRKYWSMTAQIINWCSTISTRYIHSAHPSGRYQYDRPEASTDKGVRARCSILWKDKVLEHSWYPEITKYTYHGKLLTHMNVNYLDWDEAEHNDEMHFFYDAQSRLAKVSFNREMYTYVHSLQGDIVGILDSEGALVVEYKYDAWGRLLATTVASSANEAEKSKWEALAKLNPFRYRGYVYDEESRLYYLRSRYYNPEWRRFVNVDTLLGHVGTLGSHNLFAYCRNMPVGNKDPDGRDLALDQSDQMVGGAILFTGLYATVFCWWAGKKINAAEYSAMKRRNRTASKSISSSTSAISVDDYKKDMESAEYYIAACFKSGLLWDEGNPLSFKQAVFALGVTTAANLSDYYLRGVLAVNPLNLSPYVQNYIRGAKTYKKSGMPMWGIYTKDENAAKGLALLFGSNGAPEITIDDSGYYHYHDSNHFIHIWYGDRY